MENAGYIFTAFTAVWALVFGYLIVLFNRQRRLQRDIESLKEALKAKRVGP
ncbi:MAG: CcmD family protein [Chloroflexi bacterium]|nr:CcmD family protein [Chloroflexota bacterium]